MDENVTVRVDADVEPFAAAMDNLSRLSASFGNQLAGALGRATTSGRSLEDVLRRIGLNLAGMALSQGLQPLQNLAASFMSSAFGGLAGRVTPFAAGGVVASPTYFPMRSGVGLMGEAGPEAILPLQRGADGRLGVATSSGGPAVNIVFNVTTTDAPSFAKSETQITGMLARAVARGMRSL